MAGRDHQALMEEAAGMLAGLHSGSVSQSDVEGWIGDDPARASAFARLEAGWERSERLKALPGLSANELPRSSPPLVTRRWAAGLAVGLLGAGAAGGAWLLGGAGVHRTRVGEKRTIALDDGSRIELNTNSRLRVAYTTAERRIELIRGEALFDVAKDPSRPFVVGANGAQVRAIGTAFNVRLRDEVVELTVTEGTVAVDRSPALAAEEVKRIPAGQAAIIASGAVADVPVDAEVLRRRLAWRDGAIELEGETLEQAVAEFNRYNEQRLVIADPQVAALRVGGRFGVHDVAGFLSAVEDSFKVRAVPGEGGDTYLLQG